ncbi:GDNF family receptor alpha-2 isoform X3 [Ailuropoda melanoleuca]|nr:GDNF family receptor alpha-2 isoform X3 [Ailuropoda melanoleuca]
MLANKECQAALEVLQESPLYDCRCKRGMKKELQCLQIYWSIHLGLTDGEEFYEASPYEPVTSRLSDIFRLASIFSGTGADPAVSAKSNHCLDAAKACNLNDNCKKLRSSYISICNREISPAERCNRRKCHKALRQFFDRVPSEYTYRMLFCSCQDQACAERRRQTILPSCSYEDKEKPNCLDLRGVCRTDHLCRSRLADFHANCRASYQTLTSCPADNYQACLGSYAGMIGFDMTPNYVDSSPTGIVVSPWCSCRGSGNMEEECEKFLRDFTENPCLRNAIQAFGNGTDVNLSPKSPSFQATQAPRVEKTPSLPDDLSDSTSLGTSVITTCTSVQMLTLFITGRMQMKTTPEIPVFTSQLWQKSQILTKHSVGLNCGEARSLRHRWWCVKQSASLGETLVMSPRITNASTLLPSHPTCGGLSYRHSCTGMTSHRYKAGGDVTAADRALGTPPCLATGAGMNTLWYIYAVGNCSGEKGGNLHVGTHGDLQGIFVKVKKAR